jgi:hypothetical protein
MIKFQLVRQHAVVVHQTRALMTNVGKQSSHCGFGNVRLGRLVNCWTQLNRLLWHGVMKDVVILTSFSVHDQPFGQVGLNQSHLEVERYR